GRYRVKGSTPGVFGPKHLQRLQAHVIGNQKIVSADGVEAGWTAGDHLLDTRFDLAKNIVNDALHFCLRIDTRRITSCLLRAYTYIELQALASGNPSGIPSARQKREARELAREKLEEEARDGRFIKRKVYPLLWDALSNELLIGTTSVTAIDRLHTLFEDTFGHSFEPLSAGQQAFRLSEPRRQTRAVDDATPSPFVPGSSPSEVAWVLDENSRDFLGNEYLLWLWYMLDGGSDTIALDDESEAVVMLTRTLVLECPRGQSGRQSITSDGPTHL